MDFQVGDKVSFLNEKLDGVVSKIVNEEQVEVATDDGFDVPVLTSELVLIERVEIQKESQHQNTINKTLKKGSIKVRGHAEELISLQLDNQGKVGDFGSEKKIVEVKDELIGREKIQAMLKEKMQPKVVGNISLKHSHRRKDVEGEVDLHIEHLLDNWKNMSNGEIVQHQLSVVRERLNEAILAGKHRIVFIHGVGSGTLKKEVRKVISAYPGIRFEEGHFSVYGAGATLVHL
jgi:hypothetical protein